MPAPSINTPHALLRFIEAGDGYIYYMDTPVYDNLVPGEIEFSVPIISVEGLFTGPRGVRCGYRFQCPRDMTLFGPGYLIVAIEQAMEWEPYIGVPGLQIFTSPTGVALISTRLTAFLESLQP